MKLNQLHNIRETPWMLSIGCLFSFIALILLASCGGDSGGGNTTLSGIFIATLDGKQEIPPNLSMATGNGMATIQTNRDTASKTLTATLLTNGIISPTVRIHNGAPGINGPILLRLIEIPAGSGQWSTSMPLTDEEYHLIVSGNSYFNVRTAAFPDGEIRGQIMLYDIGNTTLPGIFIATLNGTQETPPNASIAIGNGTVIIDNSSKILTARVNTNTIVGPVAQIHSGTPGNNGPAIFPLTEIPFGSGQWSTNVAITDAQHNLFISGNYYFNVQTAAFPEGEIRGQIVPQSSAQQN